MKQDEAGQMLQHLYLSVLRLQEGASQVGQLQLVHGSWTLTDIPKCRHGEKSCTAKMLQIELISDQKSQHAAMFKSQKVFSTTPAEAPWCHQHRHGLPKQSSNGTCFVQAL